MRRSYTERKEISHSHNRLEQLKHQTGLIVGSGILVAFIATALYGHINTYDKVMFSRGKKASAFASSAYQFSDGERLKRPTIYPFRHLFGTDLEGRSVLARTVVSTKAYFLPGLLACSIAIAMGSVLGILAGGLWKKTLMQIIQFISGSLLSSLESFPKYIIILLALTVIPRPNFYHIVILLGTLNSAKIGRLTNERIRSLKEREFIESDLALGHSKFKIAFVHILWYNCLQLFIIQVSLQMAEVILIEVGLCYLGVISSWGYGVTPEPSWGNLLIDGSNHLSEAWWLAIFPLFVVVLTILTFYFFADKINKQLSQRKPGLGLS